VAAIQAVRTIDNGTEVADAPPAGFRRPDVTNGQDGAAGPIMLRSRFVPRRATDRPQAAVNRQDPPTTGSAALTVAAMTLATV